MSRGSCRVWVACAAACLLLALVAAAHPAAAVAAAATAERTYVIGTGGVPYSLAAPVSPAVAVVSATAGQKLTIKTAQLASFGASSDAYRNYSIAHPDPQGVEAMADGAILVADAANHLVLWMGSDGQLLWGYTTSVDPALRAPVCVRKVSNNSFLIVDRDADRVFIVGLDNTVQWQYGTTGVAGSGVDQLDSPTYADLLPNGNIAICDAGNNRVIVVRKDDYRAGAADSGYTAASIVWQYGTTGSSGSGVDQLVRPTSVQWLTAGADAGNALICDQGAGRVVEVRSSDYDQGFSAGSVVWEYPAGGGSGQPGCAVGMFGADGVVWISDSSSGHVCAVATGSAAGAPAGHEVVADFGSGAPAFTGVAHRSGRSLARGRRHRPGRRPRRRTRGPARHDGQARVPAVQGAHLRLDRTQALQEHHGLLRRHPDDHLAIRYQVDQLWMARPPQPHDERRARTGSGRSRRSRTRCPRRPRARPSPMRWT